MNICRDSQNLQKMENILVKENYVNYKKEEKKEYAKSAKRNLHSKKETEMIQNSVHTNVPIYLEVNRKIAIISHYAKKSVQSAGLFLNKLFRTKKHAQRNVVKRENLGDQERSRKDEHVNVVKHFIYLRTLKESIVQKIVQKLSNLHMKLSVMNVESDLFRLKQMQKSVGRHVELEDVEEIKKRKIEIVYDFETKPNHNYITASGLVIHNSANDDAIDMISQLSQLNIKVPINSDDYIPELTYNPKSELWEEEEDEEVMSDSSIIF